MEFFIVWIILSVLMGVWSDNKKEGFAFGFFISLFFSPLIGAIAVAVANTKYTCRYCGYSAKKKSDFCPVCGKNGKGKTLDDLRREYSQESNWQNND